MPFLPMRRIISMRSLLKNHYRWVINNRKSVLLKEYDINQLEESGDIILVGTPCKVWMGVPLRRRRGDRRNVSSGL